MDNQEQTVVVVDFAVIGGGMAGASVAYELSKSGSVVLIEQEDQCGYHSSSRSAATFIEGYGSPVWRTLNSTSRAFMESPPDGFVDHDLLSPRGTLQVGTDDDADAMRAEYDRVRETGVSVEWVEGARVEELSPALNPGTWTCGYFEPTASDIDVDGMLQGYLRLFRSHGGTVMTGSAVEALGNTGSCWAITTRDNTIEAGVVINAAGAWADEVAQMAGLARLGIQPKRRTAIAFQIPDEFPDADRWCMVGDWGENFYFRPLSAGLLMASPADESDSPPCDAQPEEIDIAIVADQIERNTRLAIPRIEESWAGLRTFAPDRNPVIGPDAAAASFIWLAGQGGTGIVGAPSAAQVAAALATGNALPQTLSKIDLAAMAPSRLDAIT